MKRRKCEDLPLPLAHVGDKKVKRFHFSEIIGRLPYVRATVTESGAAICVTTAAGWSVWPSEFVRISRKAPSSFFPSLVPLALRPLSTVLDSSTSVPAQPC